MPDLTRLAYIKSIRDWLGGERQQLATAYLKRPQPDRYLRAHAALVDDVIAHIATDIGVPANAAILAVGGYGRGFLFPASDVDILVLLPAIAPTKDDSRAIENFVSLLWDVGLEPGISVRTVAESIEEAAKDVTVDTGMLEARAIWGETTLPEQLFLALAHARDIKKFLAAKLSEQHKRHARHHDVALNLEPNIKESPGGLRDMQTVLWISRAAKLGNDWASLAANDLITAVEAKLAAKHRRVLIDLRIRLHLLANRREDRLVFDHQTALAEQLKLKPTRNKRASEVLMRRYYLSAKAIWQLNSILLANLSERITSPKRDVVKNIDDDFELVNGNIAAIDTRIFKRDPRAIFRAFLALQKTPAAEFFAADTLRALWREMPRIGPAFRADPAINALFLDILKNERLTFTLRRMSRYGILGRYLPAFGRIVGQMQHDLFHVYTVDEHILMVLRNMRRLVLPRFAHEFPFCHDLAREFDDVHLLYLACLFHDIAKGRGGDHSALGMNDARRFCKQLGLSTADGELVAWLVETHLVMSSTAQKQDLSDPEVISQFASRVVTERRLIALYLLTVADIRGTSPHVWNGWKAKLLEELFRATRRLLRGDSAVNTHWLDYKRRDTLAKLDTDIAPPIWSLVDDRYFQRFDVNDLTWHAKVIAEDTSPATPRVHVKVDDNVELFEVVVMARDRSGLFARITNAFERMQFDIVSARIYTTKHGYALDSFLVVPKSKHHRDAADTAKKIERELSVAIANTNLPDAPTARIARQAKHFPLAPEVTLRPTRDKQYFELSIICADRPGLLSGLARVLHEAAINVHDARITTLGSRAEDIFVVESAALAKGAFVDALTGKIVAAAR
jgi:[protein-PII] uridylyltransferase